MRTFIVCSLAVGLGILACSSSSSTSGGDGGTTSSSSSSSGGPAVKASSFDQTCAADTECVAVWEGTGFSCCGCPSGAINKKDLPKYQDATKTWSQPDCSGLGCASCVTPAPVQCNAGTCQACQGLCPPRDAGADG